MFPVSGTIPPVRWPVAEGLVPGVGPATWSRRDRSRDGKAGVRVPVSLGRPSPFPFLVGTRGQRGGRLTEVAGWTTQSRQVSGDRDRSSGYGPFRRSPSRRRSHPFPVFPPTCWVLDLKLQHGSRLPSGSSLGSWDSGRDLDPVDSATHPDHSVTYTLHLRLIRTL